MLYIQHAVLDVTYRYILALTVFFLGYFLLCFGYCEFVLQFRMDGAAGCNFGSREFFYDVCN